MFRYAREIHEFNKARNLECSIYCPICARKRQ